MTQVNLRAYLTGGYDAVLNHLPPLGMSSHSGENRSPYDARERPNRNPAGCTTLRGRSQLYGSTHLLNTRHDVDHELIKVWQ